MVPEPSTSATIDSEQSPGSSNTIVNAFIGAVVSIVSGFFLPFFSPVVGGGVAGYLEGGDSEHGAKVGAISGGFASIPIVLIGLVVLSFLFGAPQAAIGIFGFIIIVFGLAFTIGLSALGGLLGVYAKDEM